jgi:hypothetical protein
VSTWLPVIAAAIGAGGVSGIVGSLMAGLFARPKTKADAVSVLTDAALKQVNELQEQTAEARKEAAAARTDADAALGRLRQITIELDLCWGRLRLWQAAILSPNATLPGLREMVTDSGQNGSGR